RGVVGTGRLRYAFVTAQIALSMVLLVFAGLLLRSFSETVTLDLGFKPGRLLVAHISAPSGDARQATDKIFEPLFEQLSEDRRYQSVALAHGLPAQPENRSTAEYIVEGQTPNDMTNSAPQAGNSVVSGSYFSTLGIPNLAGRVFSEHDNASSNPVVVVNRAFVKRSYPTVNPIGRTVRAGFDLLSMNKWATIVGVVADVHMDGPTQTPIPEIYFPFLQHPRQEFDLIVREDGRNSVEDPSALRATIRGFNSEVAVKLTTMEDHLAEVVATPRFSSILASIGIYGVISYSVSQRTAEIGVRMALGADRRKIVGMVFRQALSLCGIGLVMGFGGSLIAARLLESQLFHVSAADPFIYIAVLVTLAAVAVVTGLAPALRASAVSPLQALRQE
ncbi:MAG: ABC transporter permease, partial [Acidobacteriaceae bacterium]|nr:ABC transporter permease [Acidobacteriaceae bacterium]